MITKYIYSENALGEEAVRLSAAEPQPGIYTYWYFSTYTYDWYDFTFLRGLPAPSTDAKTHFIQSKFQVIFLLKYEILPVTSVPGIRYVTRKHY